MVNKYIPAFRRYLNVIFKIAIYSLLGSFEYRTQTVTRIVRIIVEVFLTLLFINAFFDKTATIDGWNKNSVILTVGIFNVLFATIYFFISENLYSLGDDVRNGDIDGILIKPLDSQFFISCRRMHTQNIFRIIAGSLVVGFALTSLHLKISPLNFCWFVLDFLSGIVIGYSLLCAIGTIGFWTFSSSLYDLVNTTVSIARYPTDIFPKNVVGVFTIIPLIFLATVPAKALNGQVDLLSIAAPFVACFALWSSRKFLLFALRTYTSASS